MLLAVSAYLSRCVDITDTLCIAFTWVLGFVLCSSHLHTKLLYPQSISVACTYLCADCHMRSDMGMYHSSDSFQIFLSFQITTHPGSITYRDRLSSGLISIRDSHLYHYWINYHYMGLINSKFCTSVKSGGAFSQVLRAVVLGRESNTLRTWSQHKRHVMLENWR